MVVSLGRRAALLPAVAALMMLTACSGGGTEDALPAPTSSGPATPPDTSFEIVDEPLPVTSLVEVGAAGETAVEVRVAEILGTLETSQAPAGDTLITLPEDVLFDVDSADLKAESQQTLDELVEVIEFSQDASIPVVGHTDSDGTDEYNDTLSQQRAQAVVDFFVAAGVDAGRFAPEGRGEREPVADNDSDEGKQANRRVEITVEGLPAPAAP